MLSKLFKKEKLSGKDITFFILLTLFSFAAVADFKPWINWGYGLFFLWFFYYREKVEWHSLWNETLFSGTIYTYGIFLVCFLIPNVLNESWGGVSETWDYIHYMLPALFLVLILYGQGRWEGLCVGLLIAVFYVCLRADYAMLILKNFSDAYMWNRNFFSGWVLIIMPCLLITSMIANCGKVYRFASYVAMFLGVFYLLVCGCRGAAIASVVMMALGAVYVKNSLVRKVLIVVTIVMLIFLGILYGFGYLQISHSDMSRIYLWQGGINMFMEHPWIGVGFDQWNYQFGRYFMPFGSFELHIITPHNVILELLDKEGIIGLTGFIVMLSVQIKCLCRYMKIGTNKQYCVALVAMLCTLGCFLHGMVDNIIFTHIGMKTYCFFWAVVIIALIGEQKGGGGNCK